MISRRDFSFGWNEGLGALGDIGIFVPIYLSLVALNGMDPVRPLVMVGLVYIGVSLFFRVTMPVQPLKAMAAIVIARGLGMPILYAASLWLSLILLSLVISKRVEWLSRYFTPSIVKGIQFGVGLMLLYAGWRLLFLSGPAAHPSVSAPSQFPLYLSALWTLVLPQIPLTLGNAVYALCDTSRSYFGDRAARVTPQNVAASIGIADGFMGLLGGIPICHGSGGLTAHVRFGARTAGATLIAGAIYIFLAAVFGVHAHQLLKDIPPWVFGLMLGYVGICHAWLIKELKYKREFAVAATMGIIGVLTDNLAWSLAFGLLAEFFLSFWFARQARA